MKTLHLIVLMVFVLSLAACSSPTPAPTATSTATLVPTATITFTPTPLPTPTETPTTTPTAPPTDTPTPTLTFTPSPMPTPKAYIYFDLTIVNNSGQMITMKLEKVDQPGTGYEFTVPAGETKVFKIASGEYSKISWACGIMSSGKLIVSGNLRLTLPPCK